MLNETELQLSRFAEHLLMRRLVDEKRAQFYVRWVRRFLLDVPNDPSSSLRDRLECFLQKMRVEGKNTDWHISQAEKALRLYFHNYLNDENWHKPETAIIKPDKDGAIDPSRALLALEEGKGVSPGICAKKDLTQGGRTYK